MVVAAVVVLLVNGHMKQQALREAQSKARLLLDRNLATHTYLTRQLKPCLFDATAALQTEAYFDPTWMSSTFAIRQIDDYFRALSRESYYYKECAANARSPQNEADAYERAFIQEMNANRELVERADIRILDAKPYFVTLRRNEVMEETCCHGTPDHAPGDLVRQYGNERGFHRQVGDVVSAISIRVPLAAAYGEANRFAWRLSALLLVVLACLFAVQVGLHMRMLMAPLEKVRDKALQISSSDEHLGEEIPVPFGRELGELVTAFNRMSVDLRLDRDHLEARIPERTSELVAANRQLQQEIMLRERTEGEMVRLERLRAIGDLSAGVSHNLNNILTSVLGPAQILQRITDDPQVLREAASIVASAIRARNLVRRLRLSVTGEEDDALQAVAVGTAVREAVQMTRSRWKDESEAKGIAVEVTTDLEDTPPVKATVSGLSDILVNLVLNAVDAMPERGTLFISTQTVEDGVRITVRDTGVGMDGEVRRRVFEPFFTTKMDVGSGLGLSTAYGMVTRWGGTMDAESTPGKGTTVTVWLPAWMQPEAMPEEKPGPYPARRGRILIVEDDAGVRDLLSRLLGKTHDVEAARNGSEALTRFAPGRYDAAVIDLGMPGMPGDRLLAEMQRIDPSVVGILITGWDLEDGDARGSAFDFHIRKPFGDIADVERAVADAVALHDERVGGRVVFQKSRLSN